MFLVSWASGSSWPVAIYAIFLGLCTAYAVWMGPETYRDDIEVDQAEATGRHASEPPADRLNGPPSRPSEETMNKKNNQEKLWSR